MTCANNTVIAWTAQKLFLRVAITFTAEMPFSDASGYSSAVCVASRNGTVVSASAVTLEADNVTFLIEFDANVFSAGRWDAQLQVIKSGYPLTVDLEIVAFQSIVAPP